MTSGSPIKLGYWNIRGLMQPIRMLLEYTDTPYVEKLYDAKLCPDGSYDRSAWLDDKTSLGLDFPNLPYMIDETSNVSLTQSKAILRYIAMKHRPELLGTNPTDSARIEMLVGVIADIYSTMVRVAYSPNENLYLEGREKLLGTTREFLATMMNYMKGGPFCMGNMITLPDFLLHETLEEAITMMPELLKDQTATWVTTYMSAFESEPRIAAYMKSTKYIKRPFNNKMAFFK